MNRGCKTNTALVGGVTIRKKSAQRWQRYRNSPFPIETSIDSRLGMSCSVLCYVSLLGMIVSKKFKWHAVTEVDEQADFYIIDPNHINPSI